MRIYKYLLCFLLFHSGFSFAACLGSSYLRESQAYAGCVEEYNIWASSGAGTCHRLSDSELTSIGFTPSCSVGYGFKIGTVFKGVQGWNINSSPCPDPTHVFDSVTHVCGVPITCTSPQVLDEATHTCITPAKPVCSGTQTPIITNCAYPQDQGEPVDCLDGTTVYVPLACPPSAFDPSKPPTPGHPASCLGGTVATYPETCLDKYKAKIGTPDNLSLMSMILGIAPALRYGAAGAAGPLLADWNLAAKINSLGYRVSSLLSSEVPKQAIGNAIQSFIKLAPSTASTAYAGAIVSGLGAGAAGLNYYLDGNTRDIMPVGGTIPLTANQIANVAASISTPLPLSDLAPYIKPDLIPWLVPAIPAVDADFQRIYSPSGSLPPVNFPNLATAQGTSYNPYISPSVVTSYYPNPTSENPVVPFAQLGPLSASTYVLPGVSPDTSTTTPSVLSDPAVNSNPSGTDALTSGVYSVPSGTVVNPTEAQAVPFIPEIYPDQWKFFNFLPTVNPFSFDVSKYLPSIPTTSCYYEIHRVFHVPFLGDKQFDFAPCAKLQPLRVVLQWAFSVLTMWACFVLVFKSHV